MSARYQVMCGDMRVVLKEVPTSSVDSVVTDPPYGLSFMGKGWDGQVPGPEYWQEALRVAKPGAHFLAFGGTRTAHRLACAIEDAGWELRDCLSWLYGSGFPKSHDISKAIDREAGVVRTIVSRPGVKSGCSPDMNTYASGLNAGFQQRELLAPATPAAAQWNGWGTALKPAWEPIYLARKPLVGTVASNVLEYGCGGINVDGCRIEPQQVDDYGRSPAGSDGRKHAHRGTSFETPDRPGECTSPLGRWPANLLLDESSAAMLDEQTGVLKSGALNAGHKRGGMGDTAYGDGDGGIIARNYGNDSGGASRFFYVAKASRAEREQGLNGNGARANTHPTVKPIALMRWLVRLITPPNGIVLDPFAGSGSTGCAALLEGMRFLGIELQPEYRALAEARIAHVEAA